MRKRERGVRDIAMSSPEPGVLSRESRRMKWILAFFLVIFTNCLPAQNIHPLSIGDTLPKCSIKKVLNKTKPAILDCWSTYCSSCLSGFVKLDSLAKACNNGFTILAVNNQPVAVVRQFLEQHPEIKNLDIQFISADEKLKQFFPYKLLPHLVWLDNQQIVRAITSSREMTASNLQLLLQNKPLRLRLKKDQMDFKSDQPLLIYNNGGHENFFNYRCIITPYIGGIPFEAGWRTDSLTKTTRIFIYDHSIVQLCGFALLPFHQFKPEHIVLEVKDSSRFLNLNKGFEHDADWDKDNRFCYELIAPMMSREAIKLQMQLDLLRFFNVFARIEKRDTEEGKDIPYLIIHQN